MRLRWLATLAIVPLVGLAACGQGGEQAGEAMEGGGAAAGDTAADTTRATTFELSTKGQTGITGTATVRPSGADSLEVRVELAGLDQGASYPAHVHEGTCSEGGPVGTPLNNVSGVAGGVGEGTTVLARSDLSAGQAYFVQVHLPDGTPAACGDLPSGALEQEGGSMGGGSGSGGSSGGGS